MMSEEELRKCIDCFTDDTPLLAEMQIQMLSTLYLLGSYVNFDADRSEVQEKKEKKKG